MAISADQASRETPLPNLEVVHHGLDPARFDWRPVPRGYVCFLVRFAPVKGVHTAIDAAERAGVPILAGTDNNNPYVVPGFALHDELELFVRAGLTPLQALRTATVNPAKYLEMEKFRGTIEKGKSADLVLLDADPLTDISNTRKISAVVVNGHLLTRAALDSLLARVQRGPTETAPSLGWCA